MKHCICVIFVFFTTCLLSAQNIGNMGRLPVITTPTAPNPYQPFQPRSQNNPYNPHELTDIQRRNQAVIDEDIVSMQAEIQKQSAIKQLINNGFPSQSYQDSEGKAHFYNAFEEINSMLKGEKPLNLGRAVFLVENAFLGNSLDYSAYQGFINNKVQLCNRKITEEKLNPSNNMVKNMMLFRLISDTLTFKNSSSEGTAMHLPVTYDYEGYDYRNHYGTQFVNYLMQNNIGQCHSMPLYYLVLAEAIGAEAYWSFSPMHSFVKIKDEYGRWYNLELTCNAVLSDAHYMNHSYIKAEAIRNRLYLEPMDKKTVIAQMLIELAGGYFEKYGMDDFYLQCADTAEPYLPNNFYVLLLKASYETRLTAIIAHLLDAKNPDMLKEKSPEAYNRHIRKHELYKQIDALGYEEMPPEIYSDWLRHISKQKENHENNRTLLLNEIVK